MHVFLLIVVGSIYFFLFLISACGNTDVNDLWILMHGVMIPSAMNHGQSSDT